MKTNKKRKITYKHHPIIGNVLRLKCEENARTERWMKEIYKQRIWGEECNMECGTPFDECMERKWKEERERKCKKNLI